MCSVANAENTPRSLNIGIYVRTDQSGINRIRIQVEYNIGRWGGKVVQLLVVYQ